MAAPWLPDEQTTIVSAPTWTAWAAAAAASRSLYDHVMPPRSSFRNTRGSDASARSGLRPGPRRRRPRSTRRRWRPRPPRGTRAWRVRIGGHDPQRRQAARTAKGAVMARLTLAAPPGGVQFPLAGAAMLSGYRRYGAPVRSAAGSASSTAVTLRSAFDSARMYAWAAASMMSVETPCPDAGGRRARARRSPRRARPGRRYRVDAELAQPRLALRRRVDRAEDRVDRAVAGEVADDLLAVGRAHRRRARAAGAGSRRRRRTTRACTSAARRAARR